MTGESSRYSEGDILRALQAAAADLGQPLSADRYDAFQKQRGGPTSVRIIQRYGGWNAACAAAGLAVNPARASYRRRWSRADVAHQVATFLAEVGDGSYAAYAAWAKDTPGAPSAQTVRNTFSGWAAAKEAAREAAREARGR